MSDLDETMREFGPSFDRLGLLPAEARGLIEQAMSAGAADPDMPAEAIREFALRILDGSPATARGFALLGMVVTVAEVGGVQAREALGATLDALREVDDPHQRHQAAIDLFGVSAEDLGDALFAMEVR